MLEHQPTAGRGRRRRTTGDKHDEVNRAPDVRRVDRRVQHLAAQPQPQPSAGYLVLGRCSDRAHKAGSARSPRKQERGRPARRGTHRRGRLATPHGRPYLIPILACEHLTHGRPTSSRLAAEEKARCSGTVRIKAVRSISSSQTDAILNGQRMQHSGRRTWKTVTTAP